MFVDMFSLSTLHEGKTYFINKDCSYYDLLCEVDQLEGKR